MAEVKSDWMSLKPAEIEQIVIDLAKQGESSAKIGIILRDKHGVPKAKLIGKKISKIIKNAGVEFKTNDDLVKNKIDLLQKHITKNKKDYTAKRALTKKLWLIKKV